MSELKNEDAINFMTALAVKNAENVIDRIKNSKSFFKDIEKIRIKWRNIEMRKFEKVSRVKDLDFELPKRSTKYSAGYDFINPEDVQCLPDTITMVRTGIKAQFPEDETLLMFNRSSNPKKKHLILINGVGVVDADYYNNEDNEGEIAFPFYNISKEIITIKAGEKLGQGLFVKYGITCDDEAEGERKGGFGSTGK